MMEELYVDVVRGLHLLFLALGMGSALYLDLRTLKGLNQVVQAQDIVEMARIHRFVWFSLGGLWATGVFLIWIRTSFDFGQFSPKLWCKLAIVSAMTLNAYVIGANVLPVMEAQIGRRVIDLSPRALMPLAMVASISVFFWVSALALGSSKVLKAASWDVLTTWLSLTYVAIVVGGVAMVFGLRVFFLRQTARPDPYDRLLRQAQGR